MAWSDSPLLRISVALFLQGSFLLFPGAPEPIFLQHNLLDLIEGDFVAAAVVELGSKTPPRREPGRGREEAQYSLASIIVSTRVVFDGSAGSSEPNSIVES